MVYLANCFEVGTRIYGRSIRSKEDWAKMYVLDSALNFVKKNKNILPDWFG